MHSTLRVELLSHLQEKELEGLLNPSRSDDTRRLIGDRRPEAGAALQSLKQKVLKLEVQLRDKEAAYK